MHSSSLDKMRWFRSKFLAGREGRPLRVLDVGSMDVNGTYRPIFGEPGWTYVGADQSAGRNVDVVLSDPYDWSALEDASFDVVISGQAFEHIEFFWVTMLEVARVLKSGGLCCIVAPAAGYEHRYPTDCWRFYPDGARAMARWARLEVLEARTQWVSVGYQDDDSDFWKDTVLVARKPVYSVANSVKRMVKMRALGAALKLALPPPDTATSTPVPEALFGGERSPYMEYNLTTPLRDLLPIMQARIVSSSTYFGVPTQKSPTDFWIYQEIIHEQRPDVIVEIGNFRGGSALALAHLCDNLGHGRVVAVDIDQRNVAQIVRQHPRITLIEGDAQALFETVRAGIKPGERVLVIEDSSHTYENTLGVPAQLFLAGAAGWIPDRRGQHLPPRSCGWAEAGRLRSHRRLRRRGPALRDRPQQGRLRRDLEPEGIPPAEGLMEHDRWPSRPLRPPCPDRAGRAAGWP
jgi:SAM-dependent methyltransferase